MCHTGLWKKGDSFLCLRLKTFTVDQIEFELSRSCVWPQLSGVRSRDGNSF